MSTGDGRSAGNDSMETGGRALEIYNNFRALASAFGRDQKRAVSKVLQSNRKRNLNRLLNELIFSTTGGTEKVQCISEAGLPINMASRETLSQVEEIDVVGARTALHFQSSRSLDERLLVYRREFGNRASWALLLSKTTSREELYEELILHALVAAVAMTRYKKGRDHSQLAQRCGVHEHDTAWWFRGIGLGDGVNMDVEEVRNAITQASEGVHQGQLWAISANRQAGIHWYTKNENDYKVIRTEFIMSVADLTMLGELGSNLKTNLGSQCVENYQTKLQMYALLCRANWNFDTKLTQFVDEVMALDIAMFRHYYHQYASNIRNSGHDHVSRGTLQRIARAGQEGEAARLEVAYRWPETVVRDGTDHTEALGFYYHCAEIGVPGLIKKSFSGAPSIEEAEGVNIFAVKLKVLSASKTGFKGMAKAIKERKYVEALCEDSYLYFRPGSGGHIGEIISDISEAYNLQEYDVFKTSFCNHVARSVCLLDVTGASKIMADDAAWLVQGGKDLASLVALEVAFSSLIQRAIIDQKTIKVSDVSQWARRNLLSSVETANLEREVIAWAANKGISVAYLSRGVSCYHQLVHDLTPTPSLPGVVLELSGTVSLEGAIEVVTSENARYLLMKDELSLCPVYEGGGIARMTDYHVGKTKKYGFTLSQQLHVSSAHLINKREGTFWRPEMNQKIIIESERIVHGIKVGGFSLL